MNDRCFIDTNVLVYTVSNDIRRDRARQVVDEAPEVVLSAQIISEFVNVCLRKGLLSREALRYTVDHLMLAYEVVPVEAQTIKQALQFEERYGFSWWDSVMLASAYLAGCPVLYTEDLQHGQVIEGQLTITNPFSLF